MQSGELNRSIVIQANTPVQDAAGEPQPSWVKIHPRATIAAKVTPVRGSERFSVQQEIGDTVSVFKIRYRTDVTTLNRIVYAGRNWDILDVRELGRREALEIDATARSE